MATWAKIANWFSADSADPYNRSTLVLSDKLTIDLEKHELNVEGKSLSLTSDETDLILYLSKHPKHFVSPHTSLSTKWNETRTSQSEFLRVLHVLQRKLEAAGVKGRYIRVEPWYLYSFNPAP
jgi:DNA-binding response OmpR family regulator